MTKLGKQARIVTESTTKLPSSVVKPSNCNNLRILLVYSRHTDSRAFEVIYVRPTVNTVFINKHCCSPVFMLRPTVWNSYSLPSFVRTADSFTSVRSQLKTYMFARRL